MTTKALAGLLCGWAFALATGPVEAGDLATARSAVVKLTATFEDGNTKTGTGFVVAIDGDAGYVVTAAHVVPGAREIAVAFYGDPDAPRAASTVQRDETIDLAVLRVEKIPAGVAVLQFDVGHVLRDAESLHLLGHLRRSRQAMVREGPVSGHDGNRIVVNIDAAEGDSGGPLLLDGQVVGMVTRADRDFAYGVGALIILNTLAGWQVPFEIVTASNVPSPRSRAYPCDGTIISETGALVRIFPIASRNAYAIGKIPSGTAVRLLDQKEGEGFIWYQVRTITGDRDVGWVTSKHVRPSGLCPQTKRR